MSSNRTQFDDWMASLEARHLADLRFSEVARALRSLSGTYVERRHNLLRGAALSGAGKRAAFALFYAPLHFLITTHVVRHLPHASSGITTLVDLGCGTGASGAAWAVACERPPRVIGIDRHPWALGEAAAAYRAFGIEGRTRQRDITDGLSEQRGSSSFSILAAFAVNELPEPARERLLRALIERSANGSRVLIIEPVGRIVGRWWNPWRDACERAGGRADEWRFRADLPAIVAKLDRAAGLDHREITARSLWLNGASPAADPRASS